MKSFFKRSMLFSVSFCTAALLSSCCFGMEPAIEVLDGLIQAFGQCCLDAKANNKAQEELNPLTRRLICMANNDDTRLLVCMLRVVPEAIVPIMFQYIEQNKKDVLVAFLMVYDPEMKASFFKPFRTEIDFDKQEIALNCLLDKSIEKALYIGNHEELKGFRFPRYPNVTKLNMTGCTLGPKTMDKILMFYRRLKALTLKSMTADIKNEVSLEGKTDGCFMLKIKSSSLEKIHFIRLGSSNKFVQYFDFDVECPSCKSIEIFGCHLAGNDAIVRFLNNNPTAKNTCLCQNQGIDETLLDCLNQDQKDCIVVDPAKNGHSIAYVKSKSGKEAVCRVCRALLAERAPSSSWCCVQ